MKKIIFSLLLTVLLSACRVNNGDIGDFFGSWLVESLTVDGVVPDDFNDETSFWEFQNNIIKVSYIENLDELDRRWGTWAEDDNSLLLDFTHYENGVEPGTQHYQAPEWLYMPQGVVIDLTFVSRGSHHMTLAWTDASGCRIVYSLRKIW